MDKPIKFQELKTLQDVYHLKEHLREIYRLLDPRFIEVDYSATPTFDCDEGDIFSIELTGNITGITLKNPYKGRKITIIFLQDGVGNRTVAGWAASVMLAGNSFTPTATADVYSTITFVYDENDKWVETGRTLDVK